MRRPGDVAEPFDRVHDGDASGPDGPKAHRYGSFRKSYAQERSDWHAGALASRLMATAPPPEIELDPLQGDPRPLGDWVTTFHLAVVVLDPFTHESSWIIDTAARVLANYNAADVRTAWLVTGTDDQAREFLGPMADEFLTFTDPDRAFAKGLELETLPAFVHIDHALNVVGSAEGWNPKAWREVTKTLSVQMSWSRPVIPEADDPPPYPGTPALG